MNFQTLNRAIKFGKLPELETQAFVAHRGRAQQIGDYTVGTHDRVFADFLAEHDDPREHLVRADVEQRSHPETAADRLHDLIVSAVGTDRYHVGTATEYADEHGNRLGVHPVSSTEEGKPSLYYVSWHPHYWVNPEQTWRHRSYAHYAAHLDPETTHKIIEHLGYRPPS